MSRNNLLIIEQSKIIRTGLNELIVGLKLFERVQTIGCAADLQETFDKYDVDILVINPNLLKSGNLDKLKSKNPKNIQFVGLVYSYHDNDLLACFDEIIMINDSAKRIAQIFEKLKEKEVGKNQEDAVSLLSSRETDVLRCLVKGLSNKEISDELSISPHTVISHRKNIIQKLNIKSISGLTVYAIINDIISMDDVK